MQFTPFARACYVKKYLRFLLLCSIISFCYIHIYAQPRYAKFKQQKDFAKLSHVTDNEQFGFGVGYVSDGFNIDAFYGKYLTKSLLFRNDFYYEYVKLSSFTNYNWYYYSPSLSITIDKVNNQLFIDGVVGAIAGYESLTNSIMVNHPLTKIDYGEKIGVKFEYFIEPYVSLNLDLEQRFINNGIPGTLTRLALLSLAYNF